MKPGWSTSLLDLLSVASYQLDDVCVEGELVLSHLTPHTSGSKVKANKANRVSVFQYLLAA